jgi:ferritin-like metal-binding protein YciE
MKMNSLHDLYIEQLKDLHDAENQIIKALPKMIEAATSDDLRSALDEHLEQTKQHVVRLETIFSNMGESAKAKKCKGMEGLLKEGSEIIKDDEMDPEVKDAAIIAAGQHVEHYEIASYGTVRTFATLLGEEDAAALLDQTLEEEKEADQILTEIAEHVNVEAGAGKVEAESAGKQTKANRRRPAA